MNLKFTREGGDKCGKSCDCSISMQSFLAEAAWSIKAARRIARAAQDFCQSGFAFLPYIK
jgi:hypothetical protein